VINLKDILNEGSYNPANIKAYYEALCKNLKITPLPVKFNNIGKGGAAITFNSKTMKALYISFNVNRMHDVEYAVIHEITHQIKLETEKDAYLGKRDQSAKFKKLENKLIEKYMYSKFSNILWKESLDERLNNIEWDRMQEDIAGMVKSLKLIQKFNKSTDKRKELMIQALAVEIIKDLGHLKWDIYDKARNIPPTIK
jgi:hypothetical protein